MAKAKKSNSTGAQPKNAAPAAKQAQRTELMRGTLDMLILRTLAQGEMHGYAVARHIQQVSSDVLVVEEGSLYPALHRMARRGLIDHKWGVSEANRKAKYYRITAQGRRQLKAETERWDTFVQAVAGILNPTIAGA
ncbi:MAG: PadR family transcriptional regulator [Planctomycetota bacterium]